MSGSGRKKDELEVFRVRLQLAVLLTFPWKGVLPNSVGAYFQVKYE